MKTAVRIVDYGRGPQIEGHRLTVMDVFYYLHRGRDWDFIHRALPSLRRDEFDAVVAYVREHHDELVEMDNRVEERNRREMAEQEAKGLRHPIDPSLPLEQRIEKLRAALQRHKAAQAERNGDHSPR
jgi:uncharacterized protein (DUF433 family)